MNTYGKDNKEAKVVKAHQKHETDTGSSHVQIALLSTRIDELAKHLKTHKKDNHSRRGLLKMVADRRAHLKYLERKDKAGYDVIVKKLELKWPLQNPP